MELIKKIKEAEAQAEQIIGQAESEAAEQLQKLQSDRFEALAQAEKSRQKATEAAINAAGSKGLVEVENLKALAGQDRKKLREKATAKMDKATAKVLEFLKG